MQPSALAVLAHPGIRSTLRSSTSKASTRPTGGCPLNPIATADNAAALTGVTLGVLVICWMTFADAFPENLRSPFHANMITVIGTLTIFLVGLGVSRFRNSTR